MTAPAHLFFFRGLSTLGRDRVKFSLFDFGPFHGHLAPALAARGIALHPVLGMGAGPLPEMAARARAALDGHPVWQNRDARVHFFGHSAGGLIARLILASTSRPVASCLTVASPNLGSALAELCTGIPDRHRAFTLALRALGYDLQKKTGIFAELTPKRVSTLFSEADHRITSATACASIVAWAPRQEWCAPLRLMNSAPLLRDFDLPSDGMVERDAQPFGEVVAELTIDHLNQIGILGDRRRFDRLCDEIAAFVLRPAHRP